jgi:hypothetical protein
MEESDKIGARELPPRRRVHLTCLGTRKTSFEGKPSLVVVALGGYWATGAMNHTISTFYDTVFEWFMVPNIEVVTRDFALV